MCKTASPEIVLHIKGGMDGLRKKSYTFPKKFSFLREVRQAPQSPVESTAQTSKSDTPPLILHLIFKSLPTNLEAQNFAH